MLSGDSWEERLEHADYECFMGGCSSFGSTGDGGKVIHNEEWGR